MLLWRTGGCIRKKDRRGFSSTTSRDRYASPKMNKPVWSKGLKGARELGVSLCHDFRNIFPSLCRTTMSKKHNSIADLASISTISDLYKASQLHPTASDITTPPPSSSLNAKISLVRTSITTLAVTSIVNAANQSLLGGGGVVSAQCPTLDHTNFPFALFYH